MLLEMNDTGKTEAPNSKYQKLAAPIKKAYHHFLNIRGTPREISWGLAVGLMIGMTPLMGIQTIIALFAAALFRCNKISAVLGVYITNPFTAPFIYAATYFVGAKMVGNGSAAGIPKAEGITGFLNILTQAPDIFWKMFLGGFILGVPISAAGYYIAYKLLVKYQEEIKYKLAESKKKRAIKRAIKKELSKKKRVKKKKKRSR